MMDDKQKEKETNIEQPVSVLEQYLRKWERDGLTKRVDPPEGVVKVLFPKE